MQIIAPHLRGSKENISYHVKAALVTRGTLWKLRRPLSADIKDAHMYVHIRTWQIFDKTRVWSFNSLMVNNNIWKINVKK